MASTKQPSRFGRCHLCGYAIDKSVRFPDQRAGTRDHLVPKSQGGRGGRNIRPAHKGCNERRGTRKIDSTLLEEIKAWYSGQYPASGGSEAVVQTSEAKAAARRQRYRVELFRAVEQGLQVPSMFRRA